MAVQCPPPGKSDRPSLASLTRSSHVTAEHRKAFADGSGGQCRIALTEKSHVSRFLVSEFGDVIKTTGHRHEKFAQVDRFSRLQRKLGFRNSYRSQVRVHREGVEMVVAGLYLENVQVTLMIREITFDQVGIDIDPENSTLAEGCTGGCEV